MVGMECDQIAFKWTQTQLIDSLLLDGYRHWHQKTLLIVSLAPSKPEKNWPSFHRIWNWCCALSGKCLLRDILCEDMILRYTPIKLLNNYYKFFIKTGFSHGVVPLDSYVVSCQMQHHHMDWPMECHKFNANQRRNYCSRRKRALIQRMKVQFYLMAAITTVWTIWITTKVHHC